MIQKMFGAVCALSFVLVATTSFAFGSPDGWRGSMGFFGGDHGATTVAECESQQKTASNRRLDRLHSYLSDDGVSDADISTVQSILQQQQATNAEKQVELCKINVQIRDELAKDAPNRGSITRLIRQASTIREELAIGSLDSHLEIRSLLGAEVWDGMTDNGKRGNKSRRNKNRRR